MNLAEVADRLRMVRRARRKFLRLWAIDRSLVDPLVDRVAADLGTLPDSHPAAPPQGPAPDPGSGTAPEAADES